MTPKTFKLLVLANNLNWPSLQQKLDAMRAFYAPVCTLDIAIRPVSMTPVYTLYPDLAPLYVIDRGWYDVNVATPNALAADIILFITQPGSSPTYQGYMSYNNVGPWETTVFVHGEDDHVYMEGRDMGNSFELYAEHELSHVFYNIVGKRDDTHVHFPVNQANYTDDPKNVLPDFDFSTRYVQLETLKDSLLSALTAIGVLRKRQAGLVADTPVPATLISNPPMNLPSKIIAWSQAIGKWEGANPALHNPGNLKYSTLTASWGATRGPAASDGGNLCQFATDAAGEAALCNFLMLGCENELIAFHAPEARTLEGFTKVYAGNPPQGYIDGIIAALGVPGDTQISTFLS